MVRIVPCLDIKDGRVVKGINFLNLKDAGDPVENAKEYENSLCDEICVLDISASEEGRRAALDVLVRISERIFTPITFGGGIRTIEDIRDALKAGADKVSINTAAVLNPNIIKESSDVFGSQCIVLAIDAKRVDGKFKVFIYGGKRETDLELLWWAQKGVELGAGEILLTSIDRDGTQMGYDIEMFHHIREKISVPIILSGGAGTMEHFLEGAKEGANALLAASVFHYGKIKIPELKMYLKKNGIDVRI